MSEVSTPRSVELAKRLKAAGAKMYGAFWCSHCFEQKQSFGKEAMADLPYVECYPDGYFKVIGKKTFHHRLSFQVGFCSPKKRTKRGGMCRCCLLFELLGAVLCRV